MTEPTVLVADDNRLIRMLIRTSLTPLGCRLIEAEDGQEALDMAIEQSPDVLLLDVMMPRMHGYDVFEAVRSNPSLNSCRVIMLTAAAADVETLETEHSGADGYILKPFDKDELREVVRSLLPASQ